MVKSLKLRKVSILALFAVAASVVVFCASLALSLFNSPAAHADDGSTSITVSPARQPMDVNPGVNYQGELKVINSGSLPFDFDVSVSPYGVANENYDPTFEKRDDDFSQIADWVTFSDYNHTLAVGATEVVHYQIHVPETAMGGGQYAVLFAETIPSTSSASTGVTVGKRVGSLLFAKISGPSTLAGEIAEQKVDWWYQDMPARTFVRVHNIGNVDSEATYKLKVHGIFGGEFDIATTGDTGKKLILPHTTRLILLDWNRPGTWYGFYNIHQEVAFADASGVVDMWVLYCPLWLLLVILATILLIIALIVIKILKKKKAKAAGAAGATPTDPNAQSGAAGVQGAHGVQNGVPFAGFDAAGNPLPAGGAYGAAGAQGVPQGYAEPAQFANPAQPQQGVPQSFAGEPVAGGQVAPSQPVQNVGGAPQPAQQGLGQGAPGVTPSQPLDPAAAAAAQAEYEEYLRFKQWQESQGGQG